MALTDEELRKRFTPPTSDTDHVAIKRELTRAAHTLASLIHDLVPGSREESRAIEALEQAVFWAHAGVDRRGAKRPARHAEPTATGSVAEGTYRPVLCGCGNPTHSPLIACPPSPAQPDATPRPDRQ